MPASLVGLQMSFLPLSALLVVLTIPLVERFGPKRLMMIAWGVRNVLALGIFTLPFVMDRWGERAGWYLMMSTTLGFCLIRAMGMGSRLPWLHEIIPEKSRGVYFSTEMAVIQIMSVVMTVSMGLILTVNPTLDRFLFLRAVSIVGGVMSVFWMARIPGGKHLDLYHQRKKDHESEQKRVKGFSTYGIALRDKAFLRFAFQLVLSGSCLAWLTSATVMYMRDTIEFSSQYIMLLTALGCVAVAMTIHFWGKFAEFAGTGHTMFLALAGHSIVALVWLVLLPGGRVTPYLIPLVIVLGAIFHSAFWMAANRGLLTLVKDNGRAGYTNIYIFCRAFPVGCTPIIAGWAIHSMGLTGFRLCFIISGVVGILVSIGNNWIPEEGKDTPELSFLAELLHPLTPLRTAARVIWVTVGLHESNREN